MVAKGRASSSYGSLQSRTNFGASQGSMPRQQQIGKSGISAASGILNYSNYNSNTAMTMPNNTSAESAVAAGAEQLAFMKNSTINSSNKDGLVNQTADDVNRHALSPEAHAHGSLTETRPATRDVKLRSQAGRKNLLSNQ